jgi:hypothetical protein
MSGLDVGTCRGCHRTRSLIYHDGLQAKVCAPCCEAADENEAARQQRGEEPRWWIGNVLPW